MNFAIPAIIALIASATAQSVCPVPLVVVDGNTFNVTSGLELRSTTNLAQYSMTNGLECAKACVKWNLSKNETTQACIAGSLDMTANLCFLKSDYYAKFSTNVCTLYELP